jgi:hypothetical protein
LTMMAAKPFLPAVPEDSDVDSKELIR